MQKWKGKTWIYTNLQIDGTVISAWVDTTSDVNLMPASVYQQVYDDPKLELLQPMDIKLSVYNENTIQTFGTCTIPLISPVDRQKYKTTFYITNHDGSALFSCEGSLYMQLVQPHPLISKHVPHHGHIISSDHDKAYINFLNQTKKASHYKAAGYSAPSQTKPTAKPNNFIPHNLDHIKEKYGDIFEGLGKFPGEPHHINLNLTVLPKWVPCRPVPIHKQEEFNCQLAKMLYAGSMYLSTRQLLGYPAMSLLKVKTRNAAKDAHLHRSNSPQ